MPNNPDAKTTAPRFVIDAALTHDARKSGGEPGWYVVDLRPASDRDEVIARFLRKERAVEYCDLMNTREVHRG